MSEEMQTEIEKRIEETAIEIEKQAFLMAPYKETDLSDAFRAGATTSSIRCSIPVKSSSFNGSPIASLIVRTKLFNST